MQAFLSPARRIVLPANTTVEIVTDKGSTTHTAARKYPILLFVILVALTTKGAITHKWIIEDICSVHPDLLPILLRPYGRRQVLLVDADIFLSLPTVSFVPRDETQ